MKFETNIGIIGLGFVVGACKNIFSKHNRKKNDY